MFCIEARGLYIIVQTAPGERMRRSRRRMESEFRSTVMAEEHAGGTQREWAERGQKVSTQRGTRCWGVVKVRKTVCTPCS